MRAREVVVLCPAGFEEIVSGVAARELPKFSEATRSGGFIRGRSVATSGQLRGFACATNVFDVLATSPRTSAAPELAALAKSLASTTRPEGLPKRGTLRLRIHDDGTFASTSGDAARALEDRLAAWSGLRVSRRSATVEIWVIRRPEQATTVLGAKLTGGERRVEAGTLRAEVCAALARVEGLAGFDLVLDPFAGSGAIGRACVDAGARRVWLNDVDTDATRRGPSTGAITWTHHDFRALDVAPESVSAVVTDPPWGHYEPVEGGVDALYADLGRASARWLAPGGALVLLTAVPDETLTTTIDAGGLRVELDVRVLVNGRKARVVRARKPTQG